jgi:hypothetical protein
VNMEREDSEFRCHAILKYIYNWRCTRQAQIGGLCVQHSRVVSRIPAEWHHELNDRGVLLCKPIGPIELRRPDA